MVSKLLALESVITCVWYTGIVAQSYPVYCQKTGNIFVYLFICLFAIIMARMAHWTKLAQLTVLHKGRRNKL